MTQKEYAVIVKIWYDPEDYTSDIDPIDFIEETLEQLSRNACKSGYDLNFEILKNEAIDNAFTELSKSIADLIKRIYILEGNFNELAEDVDEYLTPTIKNHTKRLHEIEKVLEDANLWSFDE